MNQEAIEDLWADSGAADRAAAGYFDGKSVSVLYDTGAMTATRRLSTPHATGAT